MNEACKKAADAIATADVRKYSIEIVTKIPKISEYCLQLEQGFQRIVG